MEYQRAREFPKVYEPGHQNYYFNLRMFWKWIIFAFLHGAITFAFCMIGCNGVVDPDGQTYDLWFRSSLAFTVIILVITLKLFLEINSLNVASW